MSFLWPGMLVLLLGVPLVVVGYVSLLRRRDERAAALAAQGFVPNASARRLRKVRHVPPVLFLVAVVVLVVAFARPEVSVGLPHREGTVILAFDISNSMLAKDLQPTRMDAAKAAAKQFVEAQPGDDQDRDRRLQQRCPHHPAADDDRALTRCRPSTACRRPARRRWGRASSRR